MKRYWAIILMLVLAGVVTWFWVYQDKPEEPVRDQLGEVRDILEGQEEGGVQEPLVEIVEALELYGGQDIAAPGNSPIMAAVPAETLADYKKELAELKIKLEAEPTNVAGWMRVGQLKKLFSNYEGARDAWEYAWYLAPTDAKVNFSLGFLYGFHLGGAEKGEQLLLKALELEPKNVDYYINTADFYQIQGETEKAREIVERATSQVPENAKLMAYAGSFYQHLGEKDQAIAYLEKALKLNPENQTVKMELEKLKAGI